MKKKDLDELITVSDLEKSINELRGIILNAINPKKDFLTPKEFSARTGMNYSTVIYKCSTGKLKAFQDSPNSSWLIDATEIERLRKIANENKMDEY